MGRVIEYRDFEIVIGGENRKYFAQVLRSPAGESARYEIDFPFDPEKVQLQLENAILRSIKPVRSHLLEPVLRDIGGTLFRSLLVQRSEIRDLYTGSRLSLCGESGLRVKLRIEADPLGALPWEYVFDDLVVKDYLGLDAQTSLVRYMHMAQPVRELTVRGPLRILGMAANPQGSRDFAKLDATEERTRLDEVIHRLHENGDVDFQFVRGETHSQLFDAMCLGPWHVFHFIGHGGVDADGQGFLVLAGESGQPEAVSAAHLTRLLRLEQALRLVVLNCCDSARGNSSLARGLVFSGIPAVLAMQFPISDHAAIELASAFYQALANGEPVDGAVTRARIRMQHKSNIEWGIPVLYMRAADGRIFANQISAAAPATVPIASRQPAPASQADHAASPSPVGASAPSARTGRFDSGTFSALEQRADERDAGASAAFLSEMKLDALSQEQLAALISAGEALRARKPADEPLRRRLARVYYQLGSRFQNENSLNKAFVNISAAIDLDPSEPEYLYARANIFARGDQFDAATSDIDQAISLAPNRGELHWAKGVVCLLASRAVLHQHQLKVAVEAFTAAISCDPKVAKFHSYRGAAYTRLGKLPAALADLETALELDPDDAKTYYNRGCLRSRQLDMDAAIEDFRCAAQRGYSAANAELQRLLAHQGIRH